MFSHGLDCFHIIIIVHDEGATIRFHILFICSCRHRRAASAAIAPVVIVAVDAAAPAAAVTANVA